MTYKGFKSTLSICEGITLTRRVTKEVTCMVSERSYSSNTPPLIKTLSHQIGAKGGPVESLSIKVMVLKTVQLRRHSDFLKKS